MLFSVWVLTFLLSVGTGLYSSRRYLQPEPKRRGRHTVYQAIAGLNYIICVLSFLLMCGYLAVQGVLDDAVPFGFLLITCLMSLFIASSALNKAEHIETECANQSVG